MKTLTLEYTQSELNSIAGFETQNLVIEGDNASVLKSLCAGVYRMRRKVDFMLWDPPYNTGNNDFLYEDNFYLTKKDAKAWAASQPKKTVLTVGNSAGDLTTTAAKLDPRWVQEKDASRHAKWLNFMEVRLELAKKLMKDSGVIAVHISYQELFRLGLLMDEIFGEDNRLGIINWECAYSPKNDNKGIPSTTDYILVYAKKKTLAFRGVIPRLESSDAKYKNPDNDPQGDWRPDNFSAASGTEDYFYGIENPFTGTLCFPPDGRFWRSPKSSVCKVLSGWGVNYHIDDSGNVTVKAGQNRENARRVLTDGPWPELFFGSKGEGRPTPKRYRNRLKNEGRVLGTYWEADEVLDTWAPDEQLNLALPHELSGHNDGAKKLMKAVMGPKCPFDTPKPLKLTERLVQMFCPKDGVVLDAFGGSGTTGHAVLSINAQDGGDRKFILIERGAYCGEITAERMRRVISGKWASPKSDTKPLPGSFVFIKEHGKIDRDTILEAQRSDLEDIILTSHKGSSEEVGRDYNRRWKDADSRHHRGWPERRDHPLDHTVGCHRRSNHP